MTESLEEFREDAHAELAQERWLAHRREHEAEERARIEARLAVNERLTGMNEFRDQLREQALTFVRVDRVDALDTAVDRMDRELRELIATEREERRDQQNLRTGQRQGVSQTMAIAVAVVGVVGTIVGILGGIALLISR